MKITFRILREISDNLQKSNEIPLINFINSFDGVDIYEKFKNILICWNNDASYSLNLKIDDKPIDIQLSYIISQISNNLEKKLTIEEDGFIINLGIPNKFSHNNDILPIYSMIDNITINDYYINLSPLIDTEKKLILDKLPAKLYNIILINIVKDNNKTLTFDHLSLSKIKLNFLTNEPYMFIKGLFMNYNEDYFRDIIFHLSKRIDGQLLMDSTPLDIDYYMKCYSDELNSQNDNINL